MPIKPFNSVNGFSIGSDPISNVIEANGDINASNLTVTNKANLGNVANVIITGGSDNYILKTDGNGNLTWTAPTATLSVYESNANAGNITNSSIFSGINQ